MTKTATQLLRELRNEGFFGHVHEAGARCWACEVDAIFAAEPREEPVIAPHFQYSLHIHREETFGGWYVRSPSIPGLHVMAPSIKDALTVAVMQAERLSKDNAENRTGES